MSNEYTPTQGERDRIVGDVLAYAASEGLSELGTVQAAVRFGMEAGAAAERERCARIAEDAPGSDAIGYYASEAHAGYQEAQRHIAAAIGEEVVDQ